MGRNFLYVVIAVLVVGLGAAGVAYSEHKRNTLLEVNVGQHGISVQRNCTPNRMCTSSSAQELDCFSVAEYLTMHDRQKPGFENVRVVSIACARHDCKENPEAMVDEIVRLVSS
jgi:hypothetical protein